MEWRCGARPRAGSESAGVAGKVIVKGASGRGRFGAWRAGPSGDGGPRRRERIGSVGGASGGGGRDKANAVGEDVPRPGEVFVLVIESEEDVREPAGRAGARWAGGGRVGNLGRRPQQGERGGRQRRGEDAGRAKGGGANAGSGGSNRSSAGRAGSLGAGAGKEGRLRGLKVAEAISRRVFELGGGEPRWDAGGKVKEPGMAGQRGVGGGGGR